MLKSIRRFLAYGTLACLAFTAACNFGGPAKEPGTEEGRINYSTLTCGEGQKETPPEERIADLLQQAKSAYDDRQFAMAHRFAEKAEQLDKEKLRGNKYVPTALNIQAFCLLQLDLIDDYEPKDQPGLVRGALTKYREVLKIKPRDFRALLGEGMCQFRRHGAAIVKSEKLADGLLVLREIRHDVNAASAPGVAREKAGALFKKALTNQQMFAEGRARLLGLKEIFYDPNTQPLDKDKKRRLEAPWLGSVTAEQEELNVNEMKWIIEDGEHRGSLSKEDSGDLQKAIDDTIASWSQVRAYWRKSALIDLQGARDRFLQLREDDVRANGTPRNGNSPSYFWIDRDLAFVFTNMGGFFMDLALDEIRAQLQDDGKPLRELSRAALERYIDAKYASDAKAQSARNYVAAKGYYESFVKGHEEFERLRINKSASTNYDDVTENPFLVDLVSRYKGEMFEAVKEDRAMRMNVVLELCSLVVDPIFQVRDLEKARVYAGQLKAMAPSNPIHYFVRGTAEFELGHYKDAQSEYEAYMRLSSIVEDARLRKRVREKLDECRIKLSDRHSSEGSASGK